MKKKLLLILSFSMISANILTSCRNEYEPCAPGKHECCAGLICCEKEKGSSFRCVEDLPYNCWGY